MWSRDLEEFLEPELLQHPEKPFGNHDVPFAILCYPPQDEFEVRGEVRKLATRLENEGKVCKRISLAKLMFEVFEEEEPIGQWEEVERTLGFEDVLESLPAVLQDEGGLVARVLDKAEELDSETGVIFLMHAGAFFPFFRTSSLLSQLENRLDVPTVLLYPGQRKGQSGLRFMGKTEAEHAYRAAIYGG